jgi:hypothetical protein
MVCLREREREIENEMRKRETYGNQKGKKMEIRNGQKWEVTGRKIGEG